MPSLLASRKRRAASSPPEVLAEGQIRSLKITKLDGGTKQIEVELA
jgi:hypothetical protein